MIQYKKEMRRPSQKVQLYIKETSLCDSVEGQPPTVVVKFLFFISKDARKTGKANRFPARIMTFQFFGNTGIFS